jgi:hypothetical protein
MSACKNNWPQLCLLLGGGLDAANRILPGREPPPLVTAGVQLAIISNPTCAPRADLLLTPIEHSTAAPCRRANSAVCRWIGNADKRLLRPQISVLCFFAQRFNFNRSAHPSTNLTFCTLATAPNFAEILECRGHHLYDFIH